MLRWTSCWKGRLIECISVSPAPAMIQARMHSLIPWEFPSLSHRETPGKENAPWGNVHSEMQRLKISKCLLQQLCLNILPILVYFSNPNSLYWFSIAAITNNHKFSRLTQHLLAQSLLSRRPGRTWLRWWSAPGFTGRNHHGSRAVFLSGVSTDELTQVVGKSSNSMWL